MEQHSVFNLNKARDFKEEKSIKNKLTQSDRVLLRSFLGYCKIRQFPNDDLKNGLIAVILSGQCCGQMVTKI